MGILHRLFGGEGAEVTVPPMDGALHPDTALEDAPVLAAVPGVDNLVATDAGVLMSSGPSLLAMDKDGTTREVARMSAPIAALASSSQGIAAGLDDGTVILLDGGGAQTGRFNLPGGLHCITAMLFDRDGTLLVCNGSSRNPADEWKRDLLDGGRHGSVWRLEPAGGKWTALADGLAFPYGLATAKDGAVIVSESWRHRLIRLDGRREAVLDDLPGYPARIVPSSDGGYWLCAFAPRSQLIEFVLRETGYRREMMREIEPDYWIAPSLHAPRTFLEPLQGGSLKHLGILKPWAPTRSYGLVIRLDDAFAPQDSLHSRADGTFHGVTSCVEREGRLLASSRGTEEVRWVDLDGRSTNG